MHMYKIFSLLIYFSLFLPVATQASEIDMRAGRVRINQDSHGNIHVETGNTKLDVPSRRSYINRNFPVNHVNNFWRRNTCKKSGSVVRQETTQVRRNNRHSNQSSTVSVSCH